MDRRSEVLAANEAFYRAFEKKDIDAMSQVWSQGTSSLCVHPGWSILRGWKQVSDSWVNIFKNTPYIEINTDIISTEIRGDIAYIVLVENVMQVIKGSRVEAESLATNVFELLGGKWYLVHHHGSPVMGNR
ncbi:nuclear transport factor 2 family protein [Rivularia sp. UHCC 0363]|nr:nuclear transport factor 2 family protein [Rivularia sp. UHCC 0363]MEA5595127.1 nuclear transport factor 2 family protein [Rivularia sp. UHCC 0363]